RFAPDSAIYYPNMGSLPQGPACAREITAAYGYLQTNGVRFVNESFSCDDAEPGELSPTDGVIQDFFSREHDMLITKSAGNRGPLSEACRDTWNSLCVGSVDAEAEQSCFSSTLNPLYGLGSAAIDREEPDVMAVSGQQDCPTGSELDTVQLAGTTSDFDTRYANGTSFSAPAMLGMSVLVDQYCNAQGRSLSSVDHRALARNAGYAGNPAGWAFSTPDPDEDHDDGGGIVYLSKLKRVCDPNQPGDDEHGLISQRIDPATSGNTTPLPGAEPEYDGAPPSSVPLDQDLTPNGQTGYHWLDLWQGMSTTFDAGDRVRVNFSWEACVLNAHPEEERTVPTDFDLFFYNSTIGKGLYASQSDDDVNEGFDLIIPEGWDGDYELLLVWPDGSTGCDGGERTATAHWIKRD
ncbi:MAG: S8 family serine peptidase, partial [Myxococcales bacterium]|nr:S8 family serine peptidase [Myxococcales bacterium]